MYYNYLTDIDEYLSLEKYINTYFNNNFFISEWEINFFNTTFVNGKPFQNGNPIFSARNLKKKFLFKIVVDEDFDDEISNFETTFDEMTMYVYVTGIKNIEKNIELIFKQLTAEISEMLK